MKTVLSALAGTALLLLGLSARTGGFLIYEHGATATGMADARTALADDLNALYFNPAAITELPGLQFELGVTGFLPTLSYTAARQPADPPTYPRKLADGTFENVPRNDGQNDASAKIKLFTPIHLYAAYRIEEIGLSVGFGLNNPFGLGTYWPGDWDGRFITTESDLQTFFSQPVVAVDIARLAGFKNKFKLSLAAGYDFVWGSARIANRIDLRGAEAFDAGIRDPEGDVLLTGTATGHGWNLALYAELPGVLSVGASLRSHVSLDFSGTARFNFNAAGLLAKERLAPDIPAETGGSVTIDLPTTMNFGAAFLGVPGLKLAADFFIALFQSFDQLDIRLACLQDPQNPCPSLKQDPMKKNYHTSWQWSLGAEYQIFEGLFARVGFAMSFSPVPAETFSPDLPDGTQKMVCLGAGYRGGWYKADLGYMLAFWSVDKNNDVGGSDGVNPNGKANGTYTTLAHILALSWSMMF